MPQLSTKATTASPSLRIVLQLCFYCAPARFCPHIAAQSQSRQAGAAILCQLLVMHSPYNLHASHISPATIVIRLLERGKIWSIAWKVIIALSYIFSCDMTIRFPTKFYIKIKFSHLHEFYNRCFSLVLIFEKQTHIIICKEKSQSRIWILKSICGSSTCFFWLTPLDCLWGGT